MKTNTGLENDVLGIVMGHEAQKENHNLPARYEYQIQELHQPCADSRFPNFHRDSFAAFLLGLEESPSFRKMVAESPRELLLIGDMLQLWILRGRPYIRLWPESFLFWAPFRLNPAMDGVVDYSCAGKTAINNNEITQSASTSIASST